jgi:hypothetical protein
VLDEALVEALEAGREKRQFLLVHELLDQPLTELASTTNATASRASAISVLISRRRTGQRKPMRFGGQ